MNPTKKILVIEDEQILRDLYVIILKEAGFEVYQAADGPSVLEAMSIANVELAIKEESCVSKRSIRKESADVVVLNTLRSLDIFARFIFVVSRARERLFVV